jgi:hypothetical protein
LIGACAGLLAGAHVRVDASANVQTEALEAAEDASTAGEVADVGAGADDYGGAAAEHCGGVSGAADSAAALVQKATEHVEVLFPYVESIQTQQPPQLDEKLVMGRQKR